MPSDYRVSRQLLVRLIGVLCVGLGVVVVLLALLVAVLGLSPVVLGSGLVLAVLILLVVGGLLVRGAVLVRLDRTGYRVRLLRGAGVTGARWTDVEDVVATTVAGERCVVLRLRDGRSTTVPVRMLSGSPEAFVQDLQAHLNAGHGYRRIS